MHEEIANFKILISKFEVFKMELMYGITVKI